MHHSTRLFGNCFRSRRPHSEFPLLLRLLLSTFRAAEAATLTVTIVIVSTASSADLAAGLTVGDQELHQAPRNQFVTDVPALDEAA